MPTILDINPLFAVVGVSPTTLVACKDTSDGKKLKINLNVK
jgi:hypothetical protein